MQKTLKDYFPNIRTREAVLDEINHNPTVRPTFDSWEAKEQEQFLDYCTGAKGVKALCW